MGGVHGQVGQGVVTLFAEIHKVNKKTSALVKFQQTDHHLVEDGLWWSRCWSVHVRGHLFQAGWYKDEGDDDDDSGSDDNLHDLNDEYDIQFWTGNATGKGVFKNCTLNTEHSWQEISPGSCNILAHVGHKSRVFRLCKSEFKPLCLAIIIDIIITIITIIIKINTNSRSTPDRSPSKSPSSSLPRSILIQHHTARPQWKSLLCTSKQIKEGTPEHSWTNNRLGGFAQTKYSAS